jgi:hypothetical protein
MFEEDASVENEDEEQNVARKCVTS